MHGRRSVIRGAPRRLLRFSASARALHWTLALATLGLLASGLPLLLPAFRGWIRGYDPQVGLRLHLALSVFLLAPGLVVLLGDRGALRAESVELMRLGREDWRWLRGLPAFLVGLPCASERVGRYNGGQKLNAWGVLMSVTGLTLTGVPLWLGAPAGLLPILRWLHDGLTLVLLLLVVGHVVLATLHPRTRPALRGMVDGWVPADWAAVQYPRWAAGAAADRPAESRCLRPGAEPGEGPKVDRLERRDVQ
jgi:formate dehydrogenase subunit gamma